MWQLGLALALLSVGAAFVRDRCILAVALALLANWALNTAIVEAAHEPFPWAFFIGSDYLTGMTVIAMSVIICDKVRTGAIAIAASYALQCLAHVSYSMSAQDGTAQYYYYWTLFYIAVAQGLLVFSWGLYELARRPARNSGSVPSDLGLFVRNKEKGSG